MAEPGPPRRPATPQSLRRTSMSKQFGCSPLGPSPVTQRPPRAPASSPPDSCPLTPDSSPRRSMFGVRPRAFTLVELLVVIGIIAVLLAILLPVLSRVRGAALKTVCAARLHDLTLAAIQFQQDH